MSRVLLGMNGGVDSSASAFFLKRDGHQVVAVTLLLRNLPTEVAKANKAAATCQQLGIEHHVVDARQAFADLVVTPFVQSCSEGLYPMPCTSCISKVMVPLLMEQANAFDCRMVATGHYARVLHATNGFETLPNQLNMALHRPYDQSFLFYDLSQDQLNRLVFPLGEQFKHDVRKEAMRQGLAMPEVDKPFSVCFVDGRPLHEWLDLRVSGVFSPGEMVNVSNGAVVGRHKGLHHYAIGDEVADGRFVIGLDHKGNRLLVGAGNLAVTEGCFVGDVRWTSVYAPSKKRSCKVRLRMGETPVPCQIAPRPDGSVELAFNKPQGRIMPGMTVVFYSDSMVLGGGILR